MSPSPSRDREHFILKQEHLSERKMCLLDTTQLQRPLDCKLQGKRLEKSTSLGCDHVDCVDTDTWTQVPRSRLPRDHRDLK